DWSSDVCSSDRQPRPNTAPPSTPSSAEPPSTQISRKTISPPNMLPNSRIAKEIGLEIHSTTLRMKLKGTIHFPNGVTRKSLVKPPMPLARRPKNRVRKNTLIDSPRVALTSAVGTGFQYSTPIQDNGFAKKKSAGKNFIMFISRIQKNRVIAIGVTSLLEPW